MGFDGLRKRFALRPMQRPHQAEDELAVVGPADGRRTYQPAPIDEVGLVRTPSLPQSNESADRARYLWVIDQTDVPHALELCEWARSLSSQRLKHSNLTGGSPAYFGGELWFVDPQTLIINFCSGRYGASSQADSAIMDATVQALLEDGYRVATTGRDEENGFLSSRILLGPPAYQSASDG